MLKRPVIHVDVVETPEKKHLAKFTVRGIPDSEILFPPSTLSYRKPIDDGVKLALRQKLRNSSPKVQLQTRMSNLLTSVKIWPDRKTSGVHRKRRIFLPTALAVALVLVSLGAALASYAATLVEGGDAPDSSGTILLSIAIQGATAAGATAMRAHKVARRFEPSNGLAALRGLKFIVPLAFSVFVLWEGSAAAIANGLGWKAGTVFLDRALPAVVIFGTFLGALITGARSMYNWAIVEELQRRSPSARRAVDAMTARRAG